MGDLTEDAVFHQESLAADFLITEHAVQVGAVGEDVEGMAHAVGGGDVGIDGDAVHRHVLFDALLLII